MGSLIKILLLFDCSIILVPKYFEYGPRGLNIILTQLRCSASFLNYDLYRVNIIADPSCNCGAPCEDVQHFFLHCPRYTELRQVLFQSLHWVPLTINTDLLTKGSTDLSYEENTEIFKHVIKFIRGSNRFIRV